MIEDIPGAAAEDISVVWAFDPSLDGDRLRDALWPHVEERAADAMPTLRLALENAPDGRAAVAAHLFEVEDEAVWISCVLTVNRDMSSYVAVGVTLSQADGRKMMNEQLAAKGSLRILNGGNA
jgi:hypothetical protein